MKITRTLWSMCAVTIFMLGAVVSGVESAPVDDLMVKSGLNDQVDSFPEVVAMSVKQSTSQNIEFSQDAMTRLEDLLAVSYDTTQMKAMIREYLSNNLSESVLAESLIWLESELGMKITQVEKDASTASGELARQQYVENIAQAGISTDRRDLMQRLDDAVKGTETMIDIMINTQKAIVMSAMQGAPPSQRLGVREIDTKIEMNRPMLMRQYKNYVVNSMLYTYQDLSDNELRQYLGFADSQVGKDYHKAVIQAMKLVLTDSAQKFGAGMADSMAEAQ